MQPSSGQKRASPGLAQGFVKLFSASKRASITAPVSVSLISDSETESEPLADASTSAAQTSEANLGDRLVPECGNVTQSAESLLNDGEDDLDRHADHYEDVSSHEQHGTAESAPEAAPAVAVSAGLFEEFRFTGPARGSRGRQVSARSCFALVPSSQDPSTRRGRQKEALEDFASMSAEERVRILDKWRGMAAGSATTPGAFHLQLLVAAILHPKATETAVKACMGRLHSWSMVCNQDSSLPPGLSAKRLAAATPEVLEGLLEGLHWHKAKAGRVVAAAIALEEHFGGNVPRLREELITLPGVGPKLANLLAFLRESIDA